MESLDLALTQKKQEVADYINYLDSVIIDLLKAHHLIQEDPHPDDESNALLKPLSDGAAYYTRLKQEQERYFETLK
ncbi:hypothetical protein GO755_31490 [Spirosoma sp. HMF4905]|uniref:Uncharacterized protein n=1 Tax=Spirosoma arboris TaxID=2682092 RepID=A0A7K1SLD1_9BACT|nr:hypothetical protein [Spirosoma arboris]MVM34595.1 hypothetical protein [Spirosoma arboris]